MQSRIKKNLFFIALFSVFVVAPVFAQTITIGNVDPGPYGPGSTIAIPFHIDDSGGCIAQNNTFALYMSDASGNFTSVTPVATVSGFYATFINYTIPGSFSPAGNYKFMVQSTSPGVSSAASAAVTINATPGIAAAATSTAINVTYPEVFGQCNGPSPTYTFTNSTIGTATVTASFFNESTQAFEGGNPNITSSAYTFNAATTNYTVIARAVNSAGVVGTHAYQLINNQVSTNIGFTGNPSVCITGGVAPLTYNIDLLTATGIENNYPGDLYSFSWGDGSAATVLTLCQIRALNGQVTHNYNKPSCGNLVNGQVNSFEVDFSASNTYCGRIGSLQTSYAKIIISPTNRIGSLSDINTAPSVGCTGTPITFVNNSITGPDPNATTSSCSENPNALYSWSVDGVIKQQNKPFSYSFPYIFIKNGTHTVTLHAQSSNGACSASDITINVCIQDPPIPSFTLPASPYCLSSGPVASVNTSVVDQTCNVSQYTWTVTPATFTYAGGTDANSPNPQFNFTAPGVYIIKLGIKSASCGVIQSAPQTLVVNGPPVAILSPNVSICGSNQTLTFDTTAGSSTQTTLSGTAQPQANTYTWTVTGGNYQFTGGANIHSQYPQILFTDIATYTVSVTQQNNCSSVTANQQITFLPAPTVVAGPAQGVCQGNPVHLSGSVTGGAFNSIQWIGPGNGGVFTNPTSVTTDYIPSSADISAGKINLVLQATTSLAAPCTVISSNVLITILPTDTIVSAPTKAICSGSAVNYAIQASIPGSTFTYTASATTGVATGFFNFGNSSTIKDVLVNSNPSSTAVVTYIITPQSNGCPGTPFTFAVTLPPTPIVTPTATSASICSGQPAGVSLSSNSPNTTYTWSVTATANVTGYNNIAIATTNTAIQDVLVNNSSSTGTVTYTITPYNAAGCAGTPVPITVIVNPVAVIAYAGTAQSFCGVTSTTLNGNNPGAFKGVWQQTAGPAVVFADSTLYNTAITGLAQGNTYIFKWTISGIAPCPSTQSQVTITDNADVTPGFTKSTNSGCGNLPVLFTNTSNNQASASFLWNFGDGSALSNAVNPQHIFPQRTDGRDTTYIISLSVLNNCKSRPPFIDSVLVRPAIPVARILPTSLTGCGNYSFDIQNISPGNNISYDFYLYDGATLIQKITKTDKTDAIFNALSSPVRKTLTLFMIATGYCNNTGQSLQIPLTLTPPDVTAQMFIQNNINSGCAPLILTFSNNSAGGDNFYYNIYDSANKIIDQPLGGIAPLKYTLDSAGTFYVSIFASNPCGSNESPKIRIDVYAPPTANFAADTTGGCKDALISFTNKSVSNDPNMPVTSLAYDWDFGDGSPHSIAYTPPPHSYHFTNSPYTVTLTATNTSSGCSNVMSKKSYINVISPPVTQFTAKPDTITSIPNYSFTFADETKGSPATWKWVFSDGQTSTKQNPFITFADTGVYKVTLTTANASGCDSTISHKVQITGVPGQLFLPNAFIPSSLTQSLKVFMAKGSGIKSWHLQIFNNYGQLVWETTKLDSKGAPIDGWDGTFKGTPAPQGVYIWQATASFINGTEWKGNTYGNSLPKRAGSVHLIR